MEGKQTVDVVTSQRVAGSLALLESGQSSDMAAVISTMYIVQSCVPDRAFSTG